MADADATIQPIPPPAVDVPVMRRFKTMFWPGDIVYLKVRPDQMPGMVTVVHIPPAGITYNVSWADGAETTHYEMELTREFTPDFGQGDG